MTVADLRPTDGKRTTAGRNCPDRAVTVAIAVVLVLALALMTAALKLTFHFGFQYILH
jgi:FlaG/FlaF family flagellin (archaellin)